MSMIQIIAAGLTARGKSGRGLAEALGVNPSQITRMLKGERLIKAHEIPTIEAYLGVSLSPNTPQTARVSEVAPAPVQFPSRSEMPLDVPVRGTAVGGESDGFLFENDTIDYVRRPPGIAKTKDVFALYVRGMSMAPRFEEGDLIYLNPHLPARAGDDVVIEFVPSESHEFGEGCLKRLVKKTSTKVIVEQFNPQMDLEFDADTVKAIHRVLTLNELMGV